MEWKTALEVFADKPWSWDALSRNPNITLDIVEAHPDKPWNWRALSMNPSMTPEIKAAHPHAPWVHVRVLENLIVGLKLLSKTYILSKTKQIKTQ
jgi:hypothetical protein